MRILVNGDGKDLADALAKGLERQGYAVDVAYDGEEALRLAEVNDYDLIVLDLNLPKVDGMEVCKRLRDSGSPYWIRTDVSATSASTSDDLLTSRLGNTNCEDNQPAFQAEFDSPPSPPETRPSLWGM